MPRGDRWRDNGMRSLPPNLGSDIDEVLAAITNGTIPTGPYNRSRLIPPFIRAVEIFEIAARYDVGVCLIQKVMSTTNLGVFCYLNHPQKFKKRGHRISTERRDKKKKTAVRTCYGCLHDVNCFIERFYDRIRALCNLDSCDFIIEHMAPITWYCDFKDYLKYFHFIKYGNGGLGTKLVAEEYDKVLNLAKVPRDIRDEVKKELLVGRVKHSTFFTSQRMELENYIYSNQTLMTMLVEIYFYDFIIFNFEFPGEDIEYVLLSIKDGSIDTGPLDKSALVRPFQNIQGEYLIAEKYDLGFCPIPKIMSTINLAVFCFINRPNIYWRRKQRISTELRRHSFCKNDYVGFAEVRRAATKFVVIRDPIERFLSGYTDKCLRNIVHLCNGCGTNLGCFIEKFHRSIKKLNTSAKVDELTYHLAPLTWYCNFKDELLSYKFIKYVAGPAGTQELARQYDKLFEFSRVEQCLRQEVEKELLVGRVFHSTFLSANRTATERQFYSNQTLIDMLTQIYFYDFIVFDFPFPKLRK
ncbi:hypothetical protein Q1695_002862 [Nippostrongylus brasiliensis]|nr:hypothetical protein Q1695_002862 [Nippostrongylus brasiliensis]